MLGLAALPFFTYALIRVAPFGSAAILPAADAAHLVTLNAMSVACLTGFLGLAFAAARPARAR